MKARTPKASPVQIGEAAHQLGVDAHVLRHWEDVGILAPPRSPSGYRIYDAETMQRARMVQGCKTAGMSLDQIRIVLDSSQRGRAAVIEAQRQRIVAQQAELERTERFLEHVLTCRHSLVTRCAECSAYPEASADERQVG